jgi:hypothetical protein
MLREGKDDSATVGGNRPGIEIDPGDVLMLDSDGSWSSAETKDNPSEPSSSDGFLENPSKPTLVQVGIDKNLAQRARALDKMSDEEFEKHAEEYVQRSLKPRGTGHDLRLVVLSSRLCMRFGLWSSVCAGLCWPRQPKRSSTATLNK